MAQVHPSSVVMPGAKLADDVEIGPMCFVGEHVSLGGGTRLIAQCHVDGYTTIGERNVIYPFASIGREAQDHGAAPGTVSYVLVGDDNVFRECSTLHAGTKPDSATRVGNGCMFMNGAHAAHNTQVGNHVILASNAVLGGYAEVCDRAFVSGLVAVHQFCRVGRLAILSGGSAFSQDIPPFMMAEGRNGGVKMVNKVGLKRAGFSDETIRVIVNLFKIYYLSGLIPSNAIKKIKEDLPQIPEVVEFLEFCASSKRGVLGPKLSTHRI